MERNEMKSNKSDSTELLSFNEQCCLLFAARYAYTRTTGAARIVIEAVLSSWDKLPVNLQHKLKNEAKNEATCNLEDWQRLIDR